MAILERLILDDIGSWEFVEFCSTGADNDDIEVSKSLGSGVLRVYEDGYRVVDCRHVPISEDRGSNIKALRMASYRVQYINPNMTEIDLRGWLRDKFKMWSVGKAADITYTDLHRIARDTFGMDVGVESICSVSHVYWTAAWANKAIREAVVTYGAGSPELFAVIAKERAKFARNCYNRAKKTRLKETIEGVLFMFKETYGYCTNEMVAEELGISVQYVSVLRKNYKELWSDIDVVSSRFTRSKNDIYISGEKVHYEDGEVITKAKVERKSKEIGRPVSKPTVIKYWEYVESDFEELNKKLLGSNEDKL
jgi:hypothetical protein